MYFLNKKIRPHLNGRAIKIIQSILNTPYKIYTLRAKDSEIEYNDIKIALDDAVEMKVGDDLGMVAHLLPHTYLRSNPFNIETSDRTVVDIDGMVMTAKKKGTATITVKTLNEKYSDSITVNVVEPSEFTATELETYTLDPDLFNLIEYDKNKDLTVLDEEAWSNSNALQFLFLYMNREGYKKVTFPRNKTYLFHPVNHIYCKNNTLIDFNGSTLQTVPHLVNSAIGIYMFDTKNKINICPRGWNNVERKTMFKINLTASDQLEFRDYAYPLPTTNIENSYYVNGEIRVLDSDDTSTEYKNFIVKNKTYNGSFQFAKYMIYTIDKTQYTTNTVKLIAECYKDNVLVKEQELLSHAWNTQNFYGSKDFSFNVSGDIDTIKFKVTGMEEIKGTEIISVLGDLKIYALDENIQETTENIFFENGSILGDRMLKDVYGEEIKSKIFKEIHGMDWRNISTTESNQNIAMVKGKNIGCRNMVIGNCTGFNITIDGAKRIKCYYPDGKLMVVGGLGENGEEVTRTDYARFKDFVEIDINKTNKIRITDPTFASNYYYKYQSRIIDVYCYDSSKNFIKALKGKLRHGILSLPVNTKYVKLAVPLLVNQGEALITTGNSDFYNCIFAIELVEPLEQSFLKNCVIENNYSTGIAHSGNNFLIEGCTFNNNTGRMPWCDIDSEDGWVKMQNNIFRNNTFNSYWGTIMCAGTNYVFKNNTYNGSFTMYGQCQYFKIIGNTFNCPTNPSFDTQSDEYLVGNDFRNIKQINVCNEHSTAEYRCYYGDNTFNNIRLNNNKNSLYDIGGNSYIDVEIAGDTNTTENIICNSIGTLKGVLTITNTISLSNISIPNIINANKLGITFNNCEIFNNANISSGASVIYNNCTIYNRNLSSDTGSTYNNCTFIDGINKGTMLKGIVEDGLVLNKTNVFWYGGQKMQDLKIEPNKFASFSVSAMVNSYNNFFFNPIMGCAIKQFGSSPSKDNAEFGGAKFELASGTISTQKHNTNIGDTKYYVATMTYDSSIGVFKYYINETLSAVVTLSADAAFKNHSEYSGNDALIRTGGQSRVNHYYLYNKVLTEEEILQNVNVLSQTLPSATIYGDIVANSNVTIAEDSEYQLAVKLNKQPTQEQNVKLKFKQYNIQPTTVKLRFTPENYNEEQYITVKGYKDTNSSSDKSDVITFSTDKGYTSENDLNNNNIIGGNTKDVSVNITNTISDTDFSDLTELENKIKSLYPDKCLSFKGSFDWVNFTATTLNSNVAGDFWINDKESIQKFIHSRIFSPNDIIYYDGEYLNPLYIPKVTSDVQEKYDICIVGGGAGGVACAYSLKDKGLKVCLIERLDILGGTHLSSVNTLISNPIVPFKDNWLRKILEPLYDLGKLEICKYGDMHGIGEGTEFDKLWRNSHITYDMDHKGVQFVLSPSYMSNKYYTDLQDDIDIKLNTVFVSSNFTDKKVTSITVKNLDENNTYEIKANYFVDCSADGVLCRYGKVLDEDFYIGEDPRERFNELTYSDGYQGNHYAINTIEGSFIMGPSGKISNADKERKPDFSNVEVFDDVVKKGNSAGVDAFCGYVVVSTSNGCPIPPEVFIDEGYDAAFELAKKKSLYYAYIMNQNYITQKMLGIRESYRIKCDEMVTQSDMERRPTGQSIKENKVIALSTWWVDIHNGTAMVRNSGLNEIPYGSLIPCAFSNVLIGSRCMGASHIAQSSCRLTRCIMSMGWVCGLALEQCVKEDIDDVRNVDVERIQEEIGIYELFDEVDTWQKIGNGEA